MHEIILFTAIVLAGLIFLGCVSHLRKRGVRGFWIAAAFLAYLAGVLYFTFMNREPMPQSMVMLEPLWTYKRALSFDMGFLHVIRVMIQEGFASGLAGIHIEATELLKEIILNIIMFIPLGYFLPFFLPRKINRLWKMLLTGFFCSLVIETTQLFTQLGWFDVDDLLNNTLGAGAGYILWWIFLRKKNRRNHRK